MAKKDDEIMVYTGDVVTRKKSPKAVKIKELSQDVNVFIGQLNTVLDNAPKEVGKFEFKEFTVSAEISASGKLTLIGWGVEGGFKGALQFKFIKK